MVWHLELVRPPVYLYASFIPLFTLIIWGLISLVRGHGETDTRQISSSLCFFLFHSC